ncbi:GNAT family N-acetyltransferase [Streptococcus sp. 121]|uniref:GNAT family N-acetyltransferase n=1 Tax=Streptococcus sp. 121 TaxID=2797637 RepID=UPI001F272913|nr:GNAT family protein [Streptococcus sp. 121]
MLFRYWEDEKTRWLEIGIVIYDENYWGKGFGTQALREWISDTFDTFDMIEHIGLTTWSGNERMMKSSEKLGLKQEARIRKVRYWQGVYYDSVKYGVLREEWGVRKNSLS